MQLDWAMGYISCNLLLFLHRHRHPINLGSALQVLDAAGREWNSSEGSSKRVSTSLISLSKRVEPHMTQNREENSISYLFFFW